MPFSRIAGGEKELRADYCGEGYFYFAEDERDTFATVAYVPFNSSLRLEIWAADFDFTSDNRPEDESKYAEWEKDSDARLDQWREYLKKTVQRLVEHAPLLVAARADLDGNEGALAPTIIFDARLPEGKEKE